MAAGSRAILELKIQKVTSALEIQLQKKKDLKDLKIKLKILLINI